jgi:hypothetical protein
MEQPECVHDLRDEEARGWITSSEKVTVSATGGNSAQTCFYQCNETISELSALNPRAGMKPVAFERSARQFELAA